MNEVVLRKRDEFIQVLENYQPSDEAKQLIAETPLVIMLGVTGAGRNTIINHLVNSGKYHFIVSDTTRSPKFRDGKMEQDGVQYFFRSEEAILDDLRGGRFLEAELIHNQAIYGNSIREIEKAVKSGKIPVNEVDIGGVESIRAVKPDTAAIFVIPPSFKEWMYRLRGREVMSDTELKNRLNTARKVLDVGLSQDFFIFVINDSSHKSAEEIDTYVKEGILPNNQSAARTIAQQMRDELEAFTPTLH